jgi:hypothetical protein
MYVSHSKLFFHSCRDVTIGGEGLQNAGLRSAPRAFELSGIFIIHVPHLLLHGFSAFHISSVGPPHLVASYDKQEYREELL